MIFLRFLAPQELRAGTAVRVQEICRRMDFTLRYTPSGHNALAFRVRRCRRLLFVCAGCLTTPSEIVIYSRDANARNYRILEDLLWLERRCPRRPGQVQPALRGEGHHPKPGVPLGNGD